MSDPRNCWFALACGANSFGKELVFLGVGYGDRVCPKNFGVGSLSQLLDTCCSGLRKVQGLDMIVQEG